MILIADFLLLLFSVKDLKTVTVGKQADAECYSTSALHESHLVGPEPSRGRTCGCLSDRWSNGRCGVTLTRGSSYGVVFCSSYCLSSAQRKLQIFVPWVNSSLAVGLSITPQENLQAVAGNTCHI